MTSHSDSNAAGPTGPVLSNRRRGKREPAVKRRDFRRPAAPCGGQARELEQLGGRFGLRMKTALANYLRAAIGHESTPCETLQFSDAVSEVADGSWLIPLHTAAGERAVLTFDEPLQGYLITRLLGWRPLADAVEDLDEDDPDPDEGKEQPPIEIGEVSRAALRPFLGSVLRELNGLFRDRESEDLFEVDEARRHQAAHRLMRGADSVMRFAVRLIEGKNEGVLALLVQRRTVVPLLSVPDETAPVKTDERARGRLERAVRELGLTVSASLGSATIDLAEFLKLQPGDVLVLDRKVGEELDVHVGSVARFAGQPGRSGGRLAVRIVGHKDRKE